MKLDADFQNGEMQTVKPEKIQKILRQHGLEVTLDQAKEILEFLTTLANIAISTYLDDK